MPKPNFRYLPHTADVAFVASGKDFKGVVENSADAMFNLMFEMKKLKASKAKTKTIRIHESANNRQDLAWFVLQEIVSKVDQRGVQALKFKVNSITEAKGRVKLRGCIFYKKQKEYLALFDVKAVTPSEFRLARKNGKWSIRAILDV